MLVSENVKPHSFLLKWDPSTNNVGVVGYNVTYYPYDDMPSSATMGTVSTSTKISGLLSDKTYGCTVLAFDAAGNKSAASETLLVTTTSGTTPGDRMAAPYVDVVGCKKPSTMKMVDKAGLTTLIAGFIEGREDKACWAGHSMIYNPNTDINEDGDAAQSDYLRQFLSNYPDSAISVGGPYGLPPAANASIDVSKLTDIYKGILDNYGVKTLDFYYAGGFLADTEALGRHVEAVVKLVEGRPDTLLIYTLPVDASTNVQGFTRHGEKFLKLLSGNGVVPAVVQCLLKDFGEGSGDNLYDASVVALEAAHGQIKEIFSDEWSDDDIWTHMGACPMFGKNNNDKVFTLANQTSLNTFCQGKGMSLMSGWSIDRDANDEVGIDDYQPYDFSKEVAKFAVEAP
ncbi:fibronectin type III domain-containing protein [Candidatus Hepatobacter penaei]|uniref:fibronectin type III domain-containing protein n=1 Tax=Candidatus Hepatobacter penaei TaxID=1274402 RepID=UPI0038B71F01